eukprot:189514_1
MTFYALLIVLHVITTNSDVPPTFSESFNLRDRISLETIREWEETYETVSQIPTISGGYLTDSSVYIVKSQRNERQKKTRVYLESYGETKDNNNKYQRMPWIWNVGATSIYPSPSRNKLAIINSVTINSVSQSVIEIYDNSQLIDTIYPPSQTFGNIYKSGQLFGITWSKNEEQIAFIAERNFIKASKSLFSDKTTINTKVTLSDDGTQRYGQQYEFTETYGEQMNGAKWTSLFIFDLNKRELYYFDDTVIPDRYSLGECIFDPNNNNSLLVVAYDTFPRRLGMKFYNSRPTQLWLIKLPSPIVDKGSFIIKNAENIQLAGNDHSAQHVRFGMNGKFIVYLTTDNTLAHTAATRLQLMNWPPNKNEKIKTIIDIPMNIKSEDVIENKEFGGLMTTSEQPIPRRCWIDDETLLINSQYGHKNGALIVNIKQKTVQRFDELNDIINHFE